MVDYLKDVAIIGAGLGGCALALALSQQNIPVTVYESKPKYSDILRSGVVLTPNGLWVLDRLGVLARIQDRCFTTSYRVYKNDKDETTRKVLVTHESLYGYRNHRIWRKLLLDEMKKMLDERFVAVKYESAFNGIESEGVEGVMFLINHQKHTASLLIGMDGIYSQVRRYLDPKIEPEYTGTTGILAHIKRASVDWPYEDYEPNATIQGKTSALFFLPEDPQLEDIMIGMQVQLPDQSRADLDKLSTDQERLLGFFRKGYDEHGPTARSIIDRVTENKDTIFVWPYLKMPELSHWYSDSGRVVIAGDGAHALPPSSGQGVNQALEDGYSLTLLLKAASERKSAANGVHDGDEAGSNMDLLKALAFWQHMRQARVDAIFDWVNNYQNVERLPEAERKKRTAGNDMAKGDDMSWLYTPKLEEDVNVWLEQRA